MAVRLIDGILNPSPNSSRPAERNGWCGALWLLLLARLFALHWLQGKTSKVHKNQVQRCVEAEASYIITCWPRELLQCRAAADQAQHYSVSTLRAPSRAIGHGLLIYFTSRRTIPRPDSQPTDHWTGSLAITLISQRTRSQSSAT